MIQALVIVFIGVFFIPLLYVSAMPLFYVFFGDLIEYSLKLQKARKGR
jgi:hypothetical protein